jgi:DNA-binding PadR family transcriptional regulator
MCIWRIRNAHIAVADPSAYLPLSSQAFEVLLTLTTGDQHGYRIMRDVTERSGGALTLHAGTLYRTLARLLEQGLIEELDERPAADADDERRRYYRLTSFGWEVARAEARRLAAQVDLARARRLLEGEPA